MKEKYTQLIKRTKFMKNGAIYKPNVSIGTRLPTLHKPQIVKNLQPQLQPQLKSHSIPLKSIKEDVKQNGMLTITKLGLAMITPPLVFATIVLSPFMCWSRMFR